MKIDVFEIADAYCQTRWVQYQVLLQAILDRLGDCETTDFLRSLEAEGKHGLACDFGLIAIIDRELGAKRILEECEKQERFQKIIEAVGDDPEIYVDGVLPSILDPSRSPIKVDHLLVEHIRSLSMQGRHLLAAILLCDFIWGWLKDRHETFLDLIAWDIEELKAMLFENSTPVSKN